MNSKLIKKHFVFDENDIKNGKYTAWELIQPLWYNVNIYDGFDDYNKDLEQFTDAQRKIFALKWYEAEVCNGGHDQFFFNSTGIVWKDAIEGMYMIGADDLAHNFQKAIDKFEGNVPFEREQRWDILEQINEDGEVEAFDEIDEFYYKKDEKMEKLMNEYVKEHPSEFVVDGEYDYVILDS